MVEPPPPSTVNMFQSSSNVAIDGPLSIVVNQQTVLDQKTNRLDLIHGSAAPNAILNAGGRVDEVRCYPGTRKEVLAKCEAWMDAGQQVDNPRSGILWLSGPAGAGKSAIVQTLADRCIARRRLMVNFFFFRSDSTRNKAEALVATLVCQLLDLYTVKDPAKHPELNHNSRSMPELKSLINDVLADKPMILKQSLRDQFQHLVDTPTRTARGEESSIESTIVLLIDGLDECTANGTRDQQLIIQILHDLISLDNSPFLVLIASRPEAHLTMSFNQVGTSTDSIFLSDEYRPEDDIRLFVTAELTKIKETHHLRETLHPQWPFRSQIDHIVTKSSGQFIYPATVMRFISQSSASPSVSLDKVQGLRPVTKVSPFAQLDAVYHHILSQAENWEATKKVFAAQFMLDLDITPKFSAHYGIEQMLFPMGYQQDEFSSLISDLTAIVKYDGRYSGYVRQHYSQLVFYHASMPDFLRDRTRSGRYYIDVDEFSNDSAKEIIKCVHDNGSLRACRVVLTRIPEPTPSITEALKRGPTQKEVPQTGLSKGAAFEFLVEVLPNYCGSDEGLYKLLAQKWVPWFQAQGISFDRYSIMGGNLSRMLEQLESKLGKKVFKEITSRPPGMAPPTPWKRRVFGLFAS